MLPAKTSQQVHILTTEQEKRVRELAKATPQLSLHGRRHAIFFHDDQELLS